MFKNPFGERIFGKRSAKETVSVPVASIEEGTAPMKKWDELRAITDPDISEALDFWQNDLCKPMGNADTQDFKNALARLNAMLRAKGRQEVTLDELPQKFE